MVKISKKLEETKGIKATDFNDIEPRGYITEIVGITEYTNDKGDKSLKAMVDIIEEGKFKHYFNNRFEKNKEKGWPYPAIKYLSLKEENIEYLKGFLDAVEESNEIKLEIDYDNLNLKQFKGLKVACQFRLEYYKDKNGKIKKGLSISGFEDIHKVDDIKIPDVKYLNEYIPYEEFMKSRKY